jgi:phosphate transport system permease protein
MNQSTRDTGSSFTGRRYSRKPRTAVLIADRFARRLITASGIGGIVAVSLVGLFLVWVVLPLLRPVRLAPEAATAAATAGRDVATAAVAARIDNYGTMSWSLLPDGELVVQDLGNGAVLQRTTVMPGVTPTAVGAAGERLVLGFADGSVVTATMAFTTEYLSQDDVPAEMRDLAVDTSRPMGPGLVTRTPEGQWRRQVATLSVDPPVTLGPSPISLVDVTVTTSGMMVAALDSAGTFHQRLVTWKRNLMTGETTARVRGGDVALGADLGPGFATLKLNDTGTFALLVGADGRLVTMADEGSGFAVAGRQDLAPAPGIAVTSVALLAGKVSLAVGDAQGSVGIWFPVAGPDGRAGALACARRLGKGGAAVTALGASERSRTLAVGRADGSLEVYNATNGRRLGRVEGVAGPVRQVALSPRQDRLLALGDAGRGLWSLDAPHADVSLGMLLRPVWYEGYAAPAYVWQSSSATDSAEPKLSLVPLVFGTIKATFYSMLFGLPIALLAAVYTSEFLPRRARSRVKPVIEIMASLPSVVLGFLAALVVAPLVEAHVPGVMGVMLLGPICVLLGAHLWQLLPRDVAPRLAPLRPLAVLVCLVGGAALAWRAGPLLEAALFAGNLKAWLEGRVGSGATGWMLLLLAPSWLLVAWLNVMYGDGLLRARGARWRHRELALLDLARFLASALAAIGLALALGWLANAAGWDPRGSVFGTYVQRNALVVGVAMGFAIIPLIYTISEDALVSVPDHLRAASLGAGASKWQTAVRVVIPPAMSGLFSAAMIGLGRAVGETMIVLMAAGNTPIMEWNIFNGFRTLSANLAVELPEAVQGSTHYRTLFLAALMLFAMTFVLNTVAEAVRLHFRRKTTRL